MTKNFKLHSVRPLYQGFFTLNEYTASHACFDGSDSGPVVREVFDRGDAAGVLAYDALLDKVVLVEQFRPAICDQTDNPWIYEIIAGIIEKGESGESVARREAVEEAGAKVLHLEPIITLWPSPGGCNERFYIYLGLVDSNKVASFGGLAHEAEDIKVHVLDCSTASEMLARGEINSAGAVIALQWLLLNRDSAQERWRGIQSKTV